VGVIKFTDETKLKDYEIDALATIFFFFASEDAWHTIFIFHIGGAIKFTRVTK